MKTTDRTGTWKKDGLPFLFDVTRRSGLSDQLADGGITINGDLSKIDI